MPLLASLALDSLGVRYRERDCIVCHNRFLQRMKINNQGKPVRMKGESDKFCSNECRREYNRAHHRKLRADNAEHFRQYNRKPYRGAKAVDGWCKNHGICWIRRRNRLHKRMVEQIKSEDELKEEQ